MPHRTSWPLVFSLFLAGVAVAFQIGKMPPALGALQADLNLGLVSAGWAVSIFSLIAAALGVAFGAIAARFGPALTVVLGMVLAAAAGAAGASIDTMPLLLLSRAVEGFGFILTVVSVPPLIMAVTAAPDRPVALGLWGAYMPVGTSTMLFLAGPLVGLYGWRVTWLVTAGMIMVSAIAVYLASQKVLERSQAIRVRVPLSAVLVLARRPVPLLSAFIFGCYALQYLALFSFLPLVLIRVNGMAIGSAAALTACAALSNAAGNMAAGFLLRAGVRAGILIAVASLAMGAGALIVFNEAAPAVLRIAGATIFSAVGGVIPGTMFALAPLIVPKPELLPGINGLMLQGAAIGQLAGPPLVAWLVAASASWEGAYAAMLIAALAVAGAAALLQRAVPVRQDASI